MTVRHDRPPSSAIELNLDGLVGPTHHYGGIGLGNLASQRHRHEVANPRAAALEGLAKMRLLCELGLRQAVLPPLARPDVTALRRIGFFGSDSDVLAAAGHTAPELLSGAASTSSMWAANAATLSPSADTGDGRVHITPANLVSQWHRSLETFDTATILRTIFADDRHFAHHPPLPATTAFADEGAANHMRLATSHGLPGIEIFTFGRDGPAAAAGSRFPARQSRDASAAVARLHGLDPNRTMFLRQSAKAIDAGVFHNDVIAVANEHVLLCHEHAWADNESAIASIRQRYRLGCGGDLDVIEVREATVPLTVAVETYLFNSQLVTLPADGTGTRNASSRMALICPSECQDHPATRRWLDALTADDSPVVAVHPVNVRQSMGNGGGPACLRLRACLTPRQFTAVHASILLDDDRLTQLERWVDRHYRDRLTIADLSDPALLDECHRALDELTSLLNIGSVYRFQR